MSTNFATHPRYKLLTFGCLLLAALFGWSLQSSRDVAALLFCIACLAMAIWFGREMLSRVSVTENAVQVKAPLGQLQSVDFRQLLSVSEEGRLTRVITLLYHPKREDGLLDLDDVHSLHLPALEDQWELLELLETKAPT
ncbi:MAG: hypothetical protein HC802_18295 [Caldilineaceae bacterium]|nr:hypothetical protein [Caldilineaceae bacterium]